MQKIILTIALGLSLVGCQGEKNSQVFTKDSDKTLNFATEFSRFQWIEAEPNTPFQIKILNQFGEPIERAQVLIGQAKGTPFKNNFIETDASGVANVVTDWSTAAAVTVEAPGYIRQTLLNQKPGHIVLKLNRAFLPQRAELRGQVTQLPVVNGDKLIDFGLVVPSLSRSDLLYLDFDSVISPFSDILSVGGEKAPLPSNVSLPNQKENYFINLTVAKPTYRLMLPTFGVKQIYALRGRFLFKPVVEKLRNGQPFYELLGDFNILGGAIRDVQIAGQLTQFDIPANEIEFKSQIKTQTADAKSDELLLMLSTSEMNGQLIPTDIKKFSPNQQVSLASLEGRPAYLVSLLKKKTEFMKKEVSADRMSATVTPYQPNSPKHVLLPLLANPKISLAADIFSVQMPSLTSVNGINELAISMVISDLVEAQDGSAKVYTPNRRWEVIGLGWAPQVQLPAWPLTKSTRTQKLEINYIGTTSSLPIDHLDESLLQSATHVTHSSVEF